jgi:hypothetical protein
MQKQTLLNFLKFSKNKNWNGNVRTKFEVGVER